MKNLIVVFSLLLAGAALANSKRDPNYKRACVDEAIKFAVEDYRKYDLIHPDCDTSGTSAMVAFTPWDGSAFISTQPMKNEKGTYLLVELYMISLYCGPGFNYYYYYDYDPRTFRCKVRRH